MAGGFSKIESDALSLLRHNRAGAAEIDGSKRAFK
jgi:hypothetical protein